MSIISDREEREAALGKLTTATDEQLTGDLAYWSVAARDHEVESQGLLHRQLMLRDLHQEEEAWVALIADEMRSRRARLRQAVEP